jgi:hypothetical protein
MKGFKIILRDEKFSVKFYHDEKKNTIVCVLEDQWGSYTGKAKCNIEAGDVYSKTNGENIALDRVLEKRHVHESKIAYKEYRKRIEVIKQQTEGLFKKWIRLSLKD